MEIKGQQMTVLLLSMFIFTLGFGITVPVMPYFAIQMGGTVVDIGLLMAVFSAMELLFAPLWGKVSDRFGRKPVMIVGLIGFSVAFALSGLSTQLWMLYLFQALAGMMMAGIFPATMAYIADCTEPGERAKQMGMLGAANGAGVIFGPALASLFALWGLRVPFFVAAALALVTSVVTLAWIRESKSPDRGQISVQAKSNASWMQPQMLIFFLMMLFVMVAMASLESTFGYFTMDRFGLSEIPSSMPVLWTSVMLTGTNLMGVVFTFFGLIGVVTQALIVGKVIERAGEERTIVLGLLAMAAGTILLIFSGEMVSIIISACVIAVGIGLLMPSINSAVSRRTDKDNQGMIMGILGSFNSSGRVVGPVAGGIAYSVSMLLPYIGSAALAVASAAFITVWNRLGNGTRKGQPTSPVNQG